MRPVRRLSSHLNGLSRKPASVEDVDRCRVLRTPTPARDPPPAGIGAAVVRSAFEHDEQIWDCIFPNICSEDVELAVERFAATLPAPNRIRHLLNANPLHLARDGRVRD